MRMELLESDQMTDPHLPALPENLVPTPVADFTRHPAAVYLARLAPGSRRSQRAALETMAGILTSSRLGIDELPWHRLGYQHTQALRAAMAERSLEVSCGHCSSPAARTAGRPA